MSDGMMSSDPSLLEIPTHGSEDDVDSLPESEPDSDDVTMSDSDYDDSDADRQWKESLEQLELLLSMVIVPYAGKYFGRKFAFWGTESNTTFCPCDRLLI
jgi:Mitochondrial import 2